MRFTSRSYLNIRALVKPDLLDWDDEALRYRGEIAATDTTPRAGH